MSNTRGKKLVIRKQTLRELSVDESNNVRGGASSLGGHCSNTTTTVPPPPSQGATKC